MSSARRPMLGWPLLMDQATACAFTSTKRARFGALVAAGLFPPCRELTPGLKLWHRQELEGAAARLWQIEEASSLEQATADARRALRDFEPVAAPGADQRRRRADVSVLSARRP